MSRKNADGTEAQLISVPIIYGPREKFLARLENNPADSDMKTAIKLPMISFEMTGMTYDGNRKLPTLGRVFSRTGTTDANYLTKVYNPVPYNIEYDVNVYATTVEDGARIVEQIAPFFTPTWNATVKMVDLMPEIKTDIIIQLEGITPDDQYEGNFEKRRVVMWRLRFTVKTYLYGPVNEAKIIKIATTNMYADVTANAVSFSTIIRPGMDANGVATSNASITVPIDQIDEEDDWTYIITYEDNT